MKSKVKEVEESVDKQWEQKKPSFHLLHHKLYPYLMFFHADFKSLVLMPEV